MKIEDKILDLNFQRKAAKTALGVSMGITALTALDMNARASRLHKISGLVMLGCAIWHAGLYGSPYSEFLKNRKAKALALRNEDFDLNPAADTMYGAADVASATGAAAALTGAASAVAAAAGAAGGKGRSARSKTADGKTKSAKSNKAGATQTAPKTRRRTRKSDAS